MIFKAPELTRLKGILFYWVSEAAPIIQTAAKAISADIDYFKTDAIKSARFN